MKILIIEDDNDLRANIVKTLKILKCETDEASDGEKGLQKAIDNDYSLILCDIKMPVMDGYQVIEELRKHENKKKIPFIFITSNIDRDQVRQGMNLGADDYITKPFSIDELLTAIKTRLKKTSELLEFGGEKYKIELKKLEKKLLLNSITELPNEQALLKRFESILKDEEFVMMHIGIAGFREINDFISRKSFDSIQKEIAGRIKSIESGFEKSEYFQISNDEFFILIPAEAGTDKSNLSDRVEAFAKKLLERTMLPMGTSVYEIIFSASIGINTAKCSSNEDALISFNDAKIAKNYSLLMGGNGYYFYTKSLREKYNEISRKKLSRFITIDEKRNELKKNKSESIINNFEIKVFFLYPHSIIQKDLIYEIIKNEYAAYYIEDHAKALGIIKKYSNSVLFINIDSTLSEKEWDNYILGIMGNPDTPDVRIGILSYYEDVKKMEKYIMKMMVPCGFVKLKLGLAECKNIILKVLEANEARGARKYVRVNCLGMASVNFTVKINERLINGFIYDISSTGMACGFDRDSEVFFRKDLVLDDIQLQLKGNLCMLTGKVYGIHHGENDVIRYVLMFERIYKDDKEKIHNFIAKCLQESIEKELSQL